MNSVVISAQRTSMSSTNQQQNFMCSKNVEIFECPICDTLNFYCYDEHWNYCNECEKVIDIDLEEDAYTGSIPAV